MSAQQDRNQAALGVLLAILVVVVLWAERNDRNIPVRPSTPSPSAEPSYPGGSTRMGVDGR